VSRDAEGLRIIIDLHGGHDDDPIAIAEFHEIRNKVLEEVSQAYQNIKTTLTAPQRQSGEGRSYTTMWRKYKRRVMLAMSSQAFAQLVSLVSRSSFCY